MPNKSLLFLLLILLSSKLNAQYELGYIVTQKGENKIGYIFNEDWKYNPETIRFKSKLDSTITNYNVNSISEFGLGNKIKFLARKVNIDISSNKLSALSRSKEPFFEEKTLFLKRIIDGKLSLYQYSSGNGNKFFIYKGGSEFEQLIFKKYLASANAVAENEFYKQQLVLLFSEIQEIKQERIQNLDYSVKSIGKIISEYNIITTESSFDYFGDEESRKPDLKLNFSFGTQSTSVSFQSKNRAYLNPSFDDLNIYFGTIEGELLFFKNKLSLFTSLTLKTGVEENIDLPTPAVGFPTQKTKFTYNNSALALGIRFYVPVIKDLRIVFNAGLTQEWISNFNIDYEYSEDVPVNNRSGNNFFYGAGLSYKRLFLEGRVISNNIIFTENTPKSYDIDTSGYTIALGYKLF